MFLPGQACHYCLCHFFVEPNLIRLEVLVHQALRLRLLGELDIQPNTAVPSRFGRKAKALFCYLAVEQGRHPIDKLLTLFWNGDGQKRNRLDTELTYVRKLLPDGALPIVNGMVNWEVPETGLTVDVLEFAKLGQSVNLSDWETAVQLYRGEFWADCVVKGMGVEFDEWLNNQRQRWRHQLMTLLGKILTQSSRSPEFMSPYIQKLLQHDPLDELAMRLYLRWILRNGRFNAALAAYKQYAERLQRELHVEPSPAMQHFHERILAGRKREPHPLPRALLPLIGRSHELAGITGQLMNDACHLLNIVGPGGIGKTRLALEAAYALADVFWEGVAFIDVTAVSPQQLPYAIADALHISLRRQQLPVQYLFTQMRHREQLLILDSFEHQLPTGRDFLNRMLTAVPNLKCLVTSRERLNLRAEWLFPLSGLGQDRSDSNPAVDLFLQRVRQSNPNFSPTAADMHSIEQICQLAEGMPLAIELAAYWAREYSCQTIWNRLVQGVSFLERSVADAPERHKSMRAAFIYSWQRLAPAERQDFARLSLLPGVISLDAAHSIAETDRNSLASLVDKSMVMRLSHNQYRLHPLLRQFGLDQLHQMPQVRQESERRMLAYYVRFLEARDLAQPVEQKKDFREIGEEWDTILLVWETTVSIRAFENLPALIHGIWTYYEFAGLYAAGYDWFSQAIIQLSRLPQTNACQSMLAILYARRAWIAFRLGQFLPGRKDAQEGVRLLSQNPEDKASVEMGRSLAIHGLQSWYLGYYEQGLQSFEKGLPISKQHADPVGYGQGVLFKGFVQMALGRFEQAERLFFELLHLVQSVNDYRGVLSAQTRLSDLYVCLDQVTEARSLLNDAQDALKQMSDPFGQILCCLSEGRFWLQCADLPQAEMYTRQALQLSQDVQERWHEAECHIHLGAINRKQGKFSTARSEYQTAIGLAGKMSAVPQMLTACAGLLYGAVEENGRLSSTAHLFAQQIADHPATTAIVKQELVYLRTQVKNSAPESAHSLSFETDELVAATLQEIEHIYTKG